MASRLHPSLLVLLLGLGCGWEDSRGGLGMDPPEPVVRVGERLMLQALAIDALAEEPTWEIMEFHGGGLLKSRGPKVTYLAPVGAGTFHVVLRARRLDGSPMRMFIPVRVLPVVQIHPPFIKLSPEGTCTFTVQIKGVARSEVTWTLTEPGAGSIAEDGTYTAPNVPGIYHVEATCTTHPDATASAVVKVE